MKYFSCKLEDLLEMDKIALKKSIVEANGRTIMGEMICTNQQTYPEITDAELISSFGSDIILLNQFDILNPIIPGLSVDFDPIHKIMDLTGKLIGIIIEPNVISTNKDNFDNMIAQCIRTKVKFLVITSNPGVQDTIEQYLNTLKRINKIDINKDLTILLGKLHFNNHNETINDFFSEDNILLLKEYEADGVVLPSPGTCPGSDLMTIKNIIDNAHKHGLIAMTTIATSQEDSDMETIKEIALLNKMAGADIHHIGDGGVRCASPENIMAYSIAIRGKRHTYTVMAKSIKR